MLSVSNEIGDVKIAIAEHGIPEFVEQYKLDLKNLQTIQKVLDLLPLLTPMVDVLLEQVNEFTDNECVYGIKDAYKITDIEQVLSLVKELQNV